MFKNKRLSKRKIIYEFLILIPARYNSSRFKGKPLKKIFGKEMVIRVAEQCKSCK